MTTDDIITSPHTTTVAIGVIVGALVRLAKDDRFPVAISPRWRPALALVLGLLGGAAARLAAGGSWVDAIASGVQGAGLASLGHGVGVEGLRGGRELGSGR